MSILDQILRYNVKTYDPLRAFVTTLSGFMSYAEKHPHIAGKDLATPEEQNAILQGTLVDKTNQFTQGYLNGLMNTNTISLQEASTIMTQAINSINSKYVVISNYNPENEDIHEYCGRITDAEKFFNVEFVSHVSEHLMYKEMFEHLEQFPNDLESRDCEWPHNKSPLDIY